MIRGGTATIRQPVAAGLSRPRMVELYERDRLGFLMDAVDRHGPVVELASGIVLVADPSAVRDVFARTDSSFVIARNFMRGPSRARPGGQAHRNWLRARDAFRTALANVSLEDHHRWLTVELQALAQRWLHAGVVEDPVRDLEDLTSRSFTRLCFGTRPVGEMPGRTRSLLEALVSVMASPFELPPALQRLLPRGRRVDRARLELEATIEGGLEAPGIGGLVDSLLAAQLDRDSLRQVILSTAIAAYRVPAAAGAWALVELARHPRIHDELLAARPWESLGRLDASTVLGRIVHETLRLWPPTWLVTRSSIREEVCGSWILPAGYSTMVAPFVVHRTASCFDQPLEFDPGRWNHLEPPPGAFVPFGGGPRACIGASLGVLEMATTVAALARWVRLSLLDGPPIPDVRTTLLPSRFRLKAELAPV